MNPNTPSQPHLIESTLAARPGPTPAEHQHVPGAPAVRAAAGPSMAGRRLRRAAVVAGAAGTGAVAHVIITSAGGLDLVVTGGGTPMTVTTAASAFAGLVAGLLGWGLLALLERSAKRPARTWAITAALVLLLSLLGPATAGAEPAVLLGLLTLHLVVGAELIALLPRTARAERAEPDGRGAPDGRGVPDGAR